MKAMFDYLVENPVLLIIVLAVAPGLLIEAIGAIVNSINSRRDKKNLYKPLGGLK